MLRIYKPTNREYSRNVATSREIIRRWEPTFRGCILRATRRSGRLPALAEVRPATVPLGHLVFQTKRWNEAIGMADLKATAF